MKIQVNVNLGTVPQRLKNLKELRGFKRGLHAAGIHLQSKIRVYPPVSRRKAVFTSDAHRRAFFAMLKRGKINVPYRRGQSPSSQRLASRWAVSRRNGGLSVVVGNNATYARRVQGDRQTAYHKKTGWKTISDVAKAERPTVVRIIQREIKKSI